MHTRFAPETVADKSIVLELAATSGARANGYDPNTATAKLRSGDRMQSGQDLTFNLTGHAFFIPNQKSLTIKTNNIGEAIVPFMDNVAECVDIICQYNGQHIVNNTVFSNFTIFPAQYISARVITDNAQAQTGHENIITYTVTNTASQLPVNDVLMQFSVTGSAIPHSYLGLTNNEGQFTLHIRNATAEEVIVSASLHADPSADNHTYIRFIPALPAYQISAEIITNNAIANGTDRNSVIIYINDINSGIPAGNEPFNIIALNNAPSITARITENDGRYIYIVSDTIARTWNYRAELTGDTTVSVDFSLNFVQ